MKAVGKLKLKIIIKAEDGATLDTAVVEVSQDVANDSEKLRQHFIREMCGNRVNFNRVSNLLYAEKEIEF